MENTDFAWALRKCLSGKKIHRAGWNGKGIFIFYQAGYPDGVQSNHATSIALGIPEGTLIKVKPYLVIKNVQDEFVPYTPNQSDILATDWETV